MGSAGAADIMVAIGLNCGLLASWFLYRGFVIGRRQARIAGRWWYSPFGSTRAPSADITDLREATAQPATMTSVHASLQLSLLDDGATGDELFFLPRSAKVDDVDTGVSRGRAGSAPPRAAPNPPSRPAVR